MRLISGIKPWALALVPLFLADRAAALQAQSDSTAVTAQETAITAAATYTAAVATGGTAVTFTLTRPSDYSYVYVAVDKKVTLPVTSSPANVNVSRVGLVNQTSGQFIVKGQTEGSTGDPLIYAQPDVNIFFENLQAIVSYSTTDFTPLYLAFYWTLGTEAGVSYSPKFAVVEDAGVASAIGPQFTDTAPALVESVSAAGTATASSRTVATSETPTRAATATVATTATATAAGNSLIPQAGGGKSSSSSGSGISKGAIAGIVIGSLIGVLAAAALVWFLLLRRRRNGGGGSNGVRRRGGDDFIAVAGEKNLPASAGLTDGAAAAIPMVGRNPIAYSDGDDDDDDDDDGDAAHERSLAAPVVAVTAAAPATSTPRSVPESAAHSVSQSPGQFPAPPASASALPLAAPSAVPHQVVALIEDNMTPEDVARLAAEEEELDADIQNAIRNRRAGSGGGV